MKEINSKELRNLLRKKNINLIDIRDNYSYQKGTIGNAKNIPKMYLILDDRKYLNYDEEYVLFCDSGTSSRELCRFLTNKGYDVINLNGGYFSYINDSL